MPERVYPTAPNRALTWTQQGWRADGADGRQSSLVSSWATQQGRDLRQHPSWVPPGRLWVVAAAVGQLVGCACADGDLAAHARTAPEFPSPFLESPDVHIEVCCVVPAVAGLAPGSGGAGVRPVDLRTRPVGVRRAGAAGVAAADPAAGRTARPAHRGHHVEADKGPGLA